MAILFRGGWVLAPIFVLGWFGWFLMLERYAYYFMLRGGTIHAVDGGFWKNLEKKGEDYAFEKLSHHRYGYFYALARSLKTISTCAALSPMLGLLGTVSGMVHTFENIKLFGFGNPVLFADGISEALLTTQAGLLMSFPLMLAYNFLAGRVEKIEELAWSDALKYESYVFKEGKFEVKE